MIPKLLSKRFKQSNACILKPLPCAWESSQKFASDSFSFKPHSVNQTTPRAPGKKLGRRPGVRARCAGGLSIQAIRNLPLRVIFSEVSCVRKCFGKKKKYNADIHLFSLCS